MAKYLRKEYGDIVASGNDDDKEDDDRANSKDVELLKVAQVKH